MCVFGAFACVCVCVCFSACSDLIAQSQSVFQQDRKLRWNFGVYYTSRSSKAEPRKESDKSVRLWERNPAPSIHHSHSHSSNAAPQQQHYELINHNSASGLGELRSLSSKNPNKLTCFFTLALRKAVHPDYKEINIPFSWRRSIRESCHQHNYLYLQCAGLNCPIRSQMSEKSICKTGCTNNQGSNASINSNSNLHSNVSSASLILNRSDTSAGPLLHCRIFDDTVLSVPVAAFSSVLQSRF